MRYRLLLVSLVLITLVIALAVLRLLLQWHGERLNAPLDRLRRLLLILKEQRQPLRLRSQVRSSLTCAPVSV